MALDKRIFDFGAVTTLNNNDVFLVASSSGTFKITYSALKNILRNINSNKVDVYQGSENSGKILGVNSSGYVELRDAAANIQPLRITQNGTYTPSGSVDGYGPIVVNVSGGEWVTYETSVSVVENE